MAQTTRRVPWIIKYRPKKLSDYVNQEEAKNVLQAWIKEWLRGKPSKKAVLLYGPPGVGKTSLVEALAGEYNLEIVEMNASDFRRKEDVERVALRAATQLSLTGRKRIILLDEVDGMSGAADKGGIEAILKVINETKHPLILTANNPWHPDLRPLRDAVMMVQLKRLKQRDVLALLKRICESEGIECEPQALKIIYEKNMGDLRSCINDLQAIAEAFGKVTESLARTMTYYRDRELDPFETLRSLFTARYCWQSKSAISHSQVDPDLLMEWISENIPLQLTDPEDMLRAYEALSRADRYRGLIRKTGSWDLLSYVFDMMGPGVTFARKKTRFKWVAYRFPQKIKMLSEAKSAREKLLSAAKKIATVTHTSRSTVIQEFIPLLRIIYEADKEKGALMMRLLELSSDEAQVITGDPSVKELMEKPLKTLRAETAKTGVAKKSVKTGLKPARSTRGRKRARSGQTTLF